MRQNKLCKRILSVTLAAVLALGSPIAMGPSGAVGPTTAKAEEVTLPEPTYLYTFDGADDLAWQSTEGAKGEGSKISPKEGCSTVSVVLDAGNRGIAENKVLKIKNDEETYGQSYAKLPDALFTGCENGLTISMDVNIGSDNNDSSVIFSSTADGYDQWNLFKINANLITNVNAGPLEKQAWRDSSISKTSHYGDWHTITVTIEKNSMKVYLDGELNEACNDTDGPNKDNGFEGPLGQIAVNKFNVLGAGGFPETLGDGKTNVKDINDIMYDNIRVYNSALNQEQIIKLLPKITGISFDGAPTTISKSAYYVGKEDNIVRQDSGKVTLEPSISPAGAYKELDWSVSPANAATCENGVVKLTEEAKNGDVITVKATAKDGSGVSGDWKLTAKVNAVKLADVKEILVDDINLEMKTDVREPAKDAPLGDKISISKLEEENKISFTYSSTEDEKAIAKDDVVLKLVKGADVVSVENNEITALRAGTAELQAVWKYGDVESEPFTVTVNDTRYSEDYKFGNKTDSEMTSRGYFDGQGCSGYERLDGNFDIEYSFRNKSTNKESRWFNFAIALADGSGKVGRFRADRWVTRESTLLPGSEGEGPYNDAVWTVCTVPDWDAWENEMFNNGADVKVRLTRKNSVLYVTYKITTKDATYDMAAVTPLADGVGSTLYVSLTGEYCECSGIKVAPATQDIQLGTNASQDVKLSDILPVNVTGEVTVEPADGDGIVEVTPGDDKVTFKGLKNGTTTVKVTANGLTVDCNVTVSDIAVSSVELSEKEVTLKKGDTKKLTATPKPEGAANQTVTWTSSDPKVATVAEDGTITAVAAGTATITATVGTVSATCTVTVTDETAAPGETDTPGGSTSGTAIAVESVTLDKTTAELEIGASTTLTATVKPDNASNKDVTWSTSDAKVATVDETGKVTAVAAGTATITVASKSNEKAVATCVITVKVPVSDDNNNDSDNNNGNVSDNNNDNNSDNNNSGSDNRSDAKEPEATTATVTNTSGVKETVKTAEDGTATVTKVKSSKKSVTVSSTVKVKGVKYTVTVVAANAFKSCKNVTKITLPATVKKFNKKAFTGAKKIKTIVVKSKKAINVKKGAFKGLKTKKITIKAGKMSKKQLKKFKKSLKKAGFKGKVKK